MEKLKSSISARTPWTTVFPWAALLTLIGTVVTASLTGGFDFIKTQNTQQTDVRLKEMEYRSSVFEHLLVIDPDDLAKDSGQNLSDLANEERRARICLAANFGLTDIPDYVIGVSRNDATSYAAALKTRLEASYHCDSAELPSALPSPPFASTDAVTCPAMLPVGAPKTVPTTVPPNSSRAKMLLAALTELNKGIHEDCNPDVIAGYFAAPGFAGSTKGTAWSAAFISWIVKREPTLSGFQGEALRTLSPVSRSSS